MNDEVDEWVAGNDEAAGDTIASDNAESAVEEVVASACCRRTVIAGEVHRRRSTWVVVDAERWAGTCVAFAAREVKLPTRVNWTEACGMERVEPQFHRALLPWSEFLLLGKVSKVSMGTGFSR